MSWKCDHIQITFGIPFRYKYFITVSKIIKYCTLYHETMNNTINYPDTKLLH